MPSNPKLPTGYTQAVGDTGLPLEVLASSVQAKASTVGQKPRAAVWTLICRAADAREAGQDGEARALLEAARDLLEETARWRDAYETVLRERDSHANAATVRAYSCAAHGEDLRRLRGQVSDLTTRGERAEQARRVLHAWYAECVKFVERARNRRGVAGLPAPDRILSWMETQLPRVDAAHEKTLNPPPIRRIT